MRFSWTQSWPAFVAFAIAVMVFATLRWVHWSVWLSTALAILLAITALVEGWIEQERRESH